MQQKLTDGPGCTIHSYCLTWHVTPSRKPSSAAKVWIECAHRVPCPDRCPAVGWLLSPCPCLACLQVHKAESLPLPWACSQWPHARRDEHGAGLVPFPGLTAAQPFASCVAWASHSLPGPSRDDGARCQGEVLGELDHGGLDKALPLLWDPTPGSPWSTRGGALPTVSLSLSVLPGGCGSSHHSYLWSPRGNGGSAPGPLAARHGSPLPPCGWALSSNRPAAWSLMQARSGLGRWERPLLRAPLAAPKPSEPHSKDEGCVPRPPTRCVWGTDTTPFTQECSKLQGPCDGGDQLPLMGRALNPSPQSAPRPAAALHERGWSPSPFLGRLISLLSLDPGGGGWARGHWAGTSVTVW